MLINNLSRSLGRNAAYRKKNIAHLSATIEFDTSEASEYLTKIDKKFDLITCVGFLHHLETNELQNLFSLLNKSLSTFGRILLAEPVSTKRSEPKVIRWWNQSMTQKINEYISLAPTPDEAPIDLDILRQNYKQAGFELATERRGWEIFSRFNNNTLDRIVISILDRVFHKDGVVWVAVLNRRNETGN